MSEWISVNERYPLPLTDNEKGRCVQVFDGEKVRVEWYDHILANSGKFYAPWRGFESNTDPHMPNITHWADLLEAPTL